jgi:Zn finger protein HypA/HybF involved in hydrogenase expression
LKNLDSDSSYQQESLPDSNNGSIQFPILEELGTESIIKRQGIIRNEIAFILCESCYWCTSLLDIEEQIDLCPMCKSANVVRMSVSQNLWIPPI